MVNQNPPHRLSGDIEKVSGIVPPIGRFLCEFQVNVVNERCCLQGVA
jgi:hypothetical protein